MIAKLLSEALATLKTAAADIGVPLDELTADQLERYQADCFNNKHLTNESLRDIGKTMSRCMSQNGFLKTTEP